MFVCCSCVIHCYCVIIVHVRASDVDDRRRHYRQWRILRASASFAEETSLLVKLWTLIYAGDTSGKKVITVFVLVGQ